MLSDGLKAKERERIKKNREKARRRRKGACAGCPKKEKDGDKD